MNRSALIGRRASVPAASSAAQRHAEQPPAPSALAFSSDRNSALLQLQRVIGNHATLRLSRGISSTPHGIQRAEDDSTGEVAAEPGAGGLTSPRFAGDPLLEACFANRARLREGMSGASVRKVQQALVDLQFDLGAGGADGQYGPKTASAIRRFKTVHRLGFEQFGDVGPGTMRKLNELFSGAPKPDIPDDEADEDTNSCPADVDIAAALEARPAELAALNDAGETAVTAPETPVGIGQHIPIPEAIKRFKAKVNVSNSPSPDKQLNITERGQFFWARQVAEMVERELDRMRGEPTAAAFVDKGNEALTSLGDRKKFDRAVNEMQTIANTSTSPEKPAMLALLRPARLSAGIIEAMLWSALNKRPDDTLPTELAGLRSIRIVNILRTFDKTSCGTHALTVADRLKKKGGVVPRDKAVPPFGATLATGTVTTDRRPLSFDPRFHRGDVIRQTGAAGAAAQMRKAIDAGQVVHARVLSGVGIGVNPKVPPIPGSKPFTFETSVPEEHSLLIFAYDSDAFAFNDPDAGVSHKPERGFGELFLSDNRLTTASANIDLGVGVDEGGKHIDGEKRYQVITLSSL